MELRERVVEGVAVRNVVNHENICVDAVMAPSTTITASHSLTFFHFNALINECSMVFLHL